MGRLARFAFARNSAANVCGEVRDFRKKVRVRLDGQPLHTGFFRIPSQSGNWCQSGK